MCQTHAELVPRSHPIVLGLGLPRNVPMTSRAGQWDTPQDGLYGLRHMAKNLYKVPSVFQEPTRLTHST